MTQSDLIKDIASRTGTTQKVAKEFLDAFVESVQDSLMRGENVALPGFGTFRVAQRAARAGRNPRTGEPLQVAARKAPVFSAGTTLRKSVGG
ncbi:MAG: HU family DNA-binding protein [Chloroflexi bacterium]|nr:HU family DNA-binding protein [Chloroflexota bacterium]